MSPLFLVSTNLLGQVSGEAEAHGATYSLVQHASYLVIVLVLMFGLMASAKTGLGVRVFRKPITSCFEQLYLFIENMCVGTIGPHGRQYIPMIMTFWMVIFTGNVISLFMPFSLTASLSFNLGMALISVGYVQYQGIKANGFVGHLSHFSGPKLSGVMLIVSGIIFLIEIISELMKNLSLSLRLYGNIHGGHIAVESMNGLGKLFPVPFLRYIPFGEFLLPIKILTCVVQAMIFSILTCVYISMVTHHEEADGHESHGPTSSDAAHSEISHVAA